MDRITSIKIKQNDGTYKSYSLGVPIQNIINYAPTVVGSVSNMTDTDQIYVLSTDGMWYYYDGSAWTAGGEYGAVATDNTLTQAGMAADAKKTGDRITDLNGDLNDVEDRVEALEQGGSVVAVSGTTPVITALSGVRYVCGEVATLDFTPCVSGICDVVFTSGSTPTVVTLPNTVKFPDGSFTAEANKTYEINILDGVYGVVMAWT